MREFRKPIEGRLSRARTSPSGRRRDRCASGSRATEQVRQRRAAGGRHEGAPEVIVLSDLGQAFGNLRAQKTRTLLTALGIVFGVGSVIGMMSIGAGAREESLRF